MDAIIKDIVIIVHSTDRITVNVNGHMMEFNVKNVKKDTTNIAMWKLPL